MGATTETRTRSGTSVIRWSRGIEGMNEGYRAWGVLKNVLSNRGLGIKAKKCLHEGVILTTAL